MPNHIMKRVPETNAQALFIMTSAFTGCDLYLAPINKYTLEDNLERVNNKTHNMIFDIIRQLKRLVPNNDEIHGVWPIYSDQRQQIMDIEGVINGSPDYYLFDEEMKYKIVTGYLDIYIKYCDLRQYERECLDEETQKRWSNHYDNIVKEHPELENPKFLSKKYIKLQTMANNRMLCDIIQS